MAAPTNAANVKKPLPTRISKKSISSLYAAWKAETQKTVDNALMRCFIVHMHHLLDPATDVTRQKA